MARKALSSAGYRISFQEKVISLLAVTLDDGSEITTEVMRGEVYGSRLLLHFEEGEYEDEDLSIWLIKSNALDASRVAARNSLDVFLGTEK